MCRRRRGTIQVRPRLPSSPELWPGARLLSRSGRGRRMSTAPRQPAPGPRGSWSGGPISRPCGDSTEPSCHCAMFTVTCVRRSGSVPDCTPSCGARKDTPTSIHSTVAARPPLHSSRSAMASDSRVYLPSDSTTPTFRAAGLDMTGVGWSLRVACQAELDDRPHAYCQLAVGHGGAHQAQPADRQPRPETDRRVRRPLSRTVGPDEPAVAACSPWGSGTLAPSPAPNLSLPGPRGSRRPNGPVRPGEGHR